LNGYNVYRNGNKINTEIVDQTVYLDEALNNDSPCYYYVTAVYESGETLPSNIVSLNLNYVEPPEILPEEGVYLEPFEVSITSAMPNGMIYYTVDGSEPTEENILYTEPFEILYHTTVKAKVFVEGFDWSDTSIAQYYLLNPPRNLIATSSLEQVELNWEVPLIPVRGTQVFSNRLRNNNEREENCSIIATSVSERRRSSEERGSQNLSTQETRGRSSRNSMVIREEIDSEQYRSLRGYYVYRSFEGEEFVRLNPRPVSATHYIDDDPEEGNYRYYVTALYEQGESLSSEIVNVSPSSVDDEDNLFEPVTQLFKAYPNPFNPETTIEFFLRDADQVTLEIFNISGNRVNVLVNKNFGAGIHRVVWDGLDNRGRKVGSGIYFYKMTTSTYTKTNKVLMLK